MILTILAVVVCLAVAILFVYADALWFRRLMLMFDDSYTARVVCDGYRERGERFHLLRWHDVGRRPKSRWAFRLEYLDMCEFPGQPVLEAIGLVGVVAFQIFIIGCMYGSIA